MNNIRIGAATLNQTPLDWKGNKENILNSIEEAKSKKVEILCLPELCITGYGCEDLFLSDWLYIKSSGILLELLPHCKNILVAISLPIKYESKNYNATCLIRDQQIVGIYAKQNMALDGVHYEPRWFNPWPAGKLVKYELDGQEYDFGDFTYDFNGIKIGFEICEDAWRDERPAGKLYEKGVKIILNPSASHFAFGKTKLREELVVKSSENFHCTYVYANLLGNEAGRMIYDGEILIAKDGKLIIRNNWLSYQPHQLLFADIDVLGSNGQINLPEYQREKNIEFTKASSLALFDYLRKSRSKGFTLSLSGGADSSTIAVLASEMIKRGLTEYGIDGFLKKTNLKIDENWTEDIIDNARLVAKNILTFAYQGTENSSADTLKSAKALAKEIGATFHHWTIDEEVKSYTGKVEKALNRKLEWDTDDLALQNIQARSRSPIIWMFANIHNQLLLTTSNRSEGDVGYTTMDGDTSGSIAPIAAVDKHFIIQWLKWAETNLGYNSLSHVNNLAPSAELRPLEKTQTDEDDLMPYNVIVEIEKLAIRDHRSPKEVYDILKLKNLESDKLLKDHIKKFYTLWSRNQWKRERIAPSFHLDDFNVDPKTWCRFPILSHGFQEELKEL